MWSRIDCNKLEHLFRKRGKQKIQHLLLLGDEDGELRVGHLRFLVFSQQGRSRAWIFSLRNSESCVPIKAEKTNAFQMGKFDRVSFSEMG
jgi:hypothetical protein